MLGFIGRRQVGIDARDLHPAGIFQEVYQFRNLRGDKTQPVHPRIQFDMHGIIFLSFGSQHAAQGFEGGKIGNTGLQIVVDDFREEIAAGGQDHNGTHNSPFAQFDALYRIGDGQIVGTQVTHHRRKFHGAVPVSVGLDEHQQLGFGTKFGTEILIVGPTMIQVEFQTRKFLFSSSFHISSAGPELP